MCARRQPVARVRTAVPQRGSPEASNVARPASRWTDVAHLPSAASSPTRCAPPVCDSAQAPASIVETGELGDQGEADPGTWHPVVIIDAPSETRSAKTADPRDHMLQERDQLGRSPPDVELTAAHPAEVEELVEHRGEPVGLTDDQIFQSTTSSVARLPRWSRASRRPRAPSSADPRSSCDTTDRRTSWRRACSSSR